MNEIFASAKNTPAQHWISIHVRKIDYFLESAPYGFLFTSRKTLETNE